MIMDIHEAREKHFKSFPISLFLKFPRDPRETADRLLFLFH